ncbi:MAG: GPR endopeptidase [Erysipelotrichaceae bacterium]|nr:GPR endopeptidase [Erysipelotrichaceae bacterium]
MKNIKSFCLRTDLAHEDLLEESENEDYSYRIEKYGKLTSNHVKISKDNQLIPRAIGEYIGIEFEQLDDPSMREELIDLCSIKLNELLNKTNQPIHKVLLVGLGNREITADALGNEVAKQLYVTAHLSDPYLRQVAVITPGVMGQTGIETTKMVESVVSIYQPNVVIVIDALATRHLNRINRVIQMTNTGIQPGSGVGNYREKMNEETLKVPVIAIGVSTVIDMVALIHQLLEDTEQSLSNTIYEKISKNSASLIVTPKEMDLELIYLAYVIASFINHSLHSNA